MNLGIGGVIGTSGRSEFFSSFSTISRLILLMWRPFFGIFVAVSSSHFWCNFYIFFTFKPLFTSRMDQEDVLLHIGLKVELLVTETAWEVSLPRFGQSLVQHLHVLLQQVRVCKADATLVTPHTLLVHAMERRGWTHD